ncbi:MAG TPA: DinB family protein [Thermoplasmata archaeon]|nr:DinB family protein [Thermoplasmata archaeon]
MTELDALRTFYRYNARVRRNYLSALLSLSREERLKDRGASYPSLQEIFVHVLDGIFWWLQYVPQDRAGDAVLLPARDLTSDQLKEQVARAEQLAMEYLDSLDEGSLSKEMVCHFMEAGATSEGRFPIGDVLWHVVEEELQHRGELNALLWQMDVDPPIATVEDWNVAKVRTLRK